MEQLTLHTNKPTPIEFEVAVEGIKNEPSTVRFIVENPNAYDITVPCKKGANNKWSVDVPALKEGGKQYKYRIEVIVDGLFFEPVKGTVDLQTYDPSVKVDNVVAKTINEDKKPHGVPRQPRPAPTTGTVKDPVKAKKPVVESVKQPVRPTASNKSLDVKQIIETIQPKKSKKAVEDKPIPTLAESVASSGVAPDTGEIPSLKSKILDNIKKKDPAYIEQRDKAVRDVLASIK